MVIIFSNRKAREFLLQEKHVVTFRGKKRKRIGKDWLAKYYGGRKIADVNVKLLKENFKPKWLFRYLSHSGFESLEEWLDAIKRFNQGKLPEFGFVYLVEII